MPSNLPLNIGALDHARIGEILRGGVQPVRVVLRALAIRMLGAGASATEVKRCLPFSARAIRDIGRRYMKLGLEGAIYDKPRPGAQPVLSNHQRRQVLAMIQGDPPAGFARWTARMVAKEVVVRGIADQVGRETIRILLKDGL
jgi:transposase